MVFGQTAGVLWTLIKWENSNRKVCHAVCDSVDILQLTKNNNLTGETVQAKINGKMRNATIVSISDDKDYLHNEKLREEDRCGKNKRHLSFDDDENLAELSKQNMIFEQVTQNNRTSKRKIGTGQFHSDLDIVKNCNKVLLVDNQKLDTTNKKSSAAMVKLSADMLNIKCVLLELDETLSEMEKYDKKQRRNHLQIIKEVEVTSISAQSQNFQVLSFVDENEEVIVDDQSSCSWHPQSRKGETPKRTSAKKGRKAFKVPKLKDNENEEMIVIGNNGTKVSKNSLDTIDWTSHSVATRSLMITLFSRDILATHTLTGKPSPAFIDREKPKKGRLDEKIIADIIQCVKTRSNVSEAEVRSVITTKCADEHKMKATRVKKERVVLASIGNDGFGNQTI